MEQQLLVFPSNVVLDFVSTGMNQRNGTDVDAGNAMKVFTKLGYNVKIYNDQTVDQMMQVLTGGKFDAGYRQNLSDTHRLNMRNPN